MFAKPIPVYQGFSEETASEVRGRGRECLNTATGNPIMSTPGTGARFPQVTQGDQGPPARGQSTRPSGVRGTPSSARRARCSSAPAVPFMLPSACTTRHQGTSSGQQAIAWPTPLAPLTTPKSASTDSL
jgi:hypothetical protein